MFEDVGVEHCHRYKYLMVVALSEESFFLIYQYGDGHFAQGVIYNGVDGAYTKLHLSPLRTGVSPDRMLLEIDVSRVFKITCIN